MYKIITNSIIMSNNNIRKLTRGDADLFNDNIIKYTKDVKNADNKRELGKQIPEK